MSIVDLNSKPDTLKTSRFREWFKVHFLSAPLKIFPVTERTLDIGCGWGFAFKLNPNFYGVDADNLCIQTLKEKGFKVKWADISQPLPYEDGFFDNVFTHDVLEHLSEISIQQLFLNVRKILKPGGVFLNIVPNHSGYLAGIHPDVGHITFVDLNLIEKIANDTGFEIVRSWYSPLPGWLSEVFVHNKLVVLARAI